MVENTQNSSETTQFSAENSVILSQFRENTNPKPQTQPSPVLSEGASELGLEKLNPKDIEKYLWMHPIVPRGIEIKANRMTSRGFRYIPFDSSAQAVEAAQRMKELIDDSGGEIFINSWIQDGYGFGNGYATLLPDRDTGEIVRLNKEHPVFFRIARYKKQGKKQKYNYPGDSSTDFGVDYGPMKIDPVTKKPMAYTQVVYRNDNQVEPVGKELTPDQVAHLVFDTWGDEAEGISYVQYVHLVLKYLMNIEEAGAEAIYRAGFTQKKVTTDIVNEKELKKIAKNLRDINGADSIILPKGTDVTNLVPGTSEFEKFHDILMDLVAMRIGVPKPILTLDGTDINKATMDELMKDMIHDLHADEIKVRRTIEEQIFKPACKSIYGDNFDKYPKFAFNDFIEGKEEKALVLKDTAAYLQTLTDTFLKLSSAGQTETAQRILDFINDNIPTIVADNALEEDSEVADEHNRNEKVKPRTPSPISEGGNPTTGVHPPEQSGPTPKSGLPGVQQE